MMTLGEFIYWIKEVWAIIQPIFEAILGAFKGGDEAETEEPIIE